MRSLRGLQEGLRALRAEELASSRAAAEVHQEKIAGGESAPVVDLVGHPSELLALVQRALTGIAESMSDCDSVPVFSWSELCSACQVDRWVLPEDVEELLAVRST